MHPRSRWEFIDSDYFAKLNDTEKAFMSKFIDEYYGAAIKKEVQDNDLHRTKAQRKDCTDRNNARNRDEYSRGLVRGFVENIEDKAKAIDTEHGLENHNHEDGIIKLLDKWADAKSTKDEDDTSD